MAKRYLTTIAKTFTWKLKPNQYSRERGEGNSFFWFYKQENMGTKEHQCPVKVTLRKMQTQTEFCLTPLAENTCLQPIQRLGRLLCCVLCVCQVGLVQGGSHPGVFILVGHTEKWVTLTPTAPIQE